MVNNEAIRVLLCRTGETEWEAAGRLCGSADVPLSATGRAKALGSLHGLIDARLATIYCGPDEASIETARHLAAVTGGRVRVIDDLAEIHLGLWEGVTESELEEKCPTAYRQWMDDPASVSAPEGETLDEVQGRLLDAVGRIFEKAKPGSGAVAIVLRPIALGVVVCALEGQGCTSIWHKTRNGFVPQWHTIDRASAGKVRELARSVARR